MTLQLTVSPDFGPDTMPSWFLFNTLLQRATGESIHLELYDSVGAQRAALRAGSVDLIFANPFDTARLVRTAGFVPLARPANRRDEALVAVAESGTYTKVEDLPPAIRLATTDDADVNMVGMLMLEPADLGSAKVNVAVQDSHVLVAKALMTGSADAGFFLVEAFDELSPLVRRQLRPIATSAMDVLYHCFLVGPRMADRREELSAAILGLADHPTGAGVLTELGLMPLTNMVVEEAEFMIDLMDTLVA